MKHVDEVSPPDAEVLIATGCAHCPAVLAALADLAKQGRIGRLTVINVAAHPDEAWARGVRGVPWTRIGPFELPGAQSAAELTTWATRAGSGAGRRDYLRETLAAGELATATTACRRSPELVVPLIDLAGDLDTPYAVRIGVGAVLEDLAPGGLDEPAVAAIARLAMSGHSAVRADAAHYLGLAGGARARALLQELAADSDGEVREIANESLAALH